MAIPANAYYILDSHPASHYGLDPPNSSGSTNSARSQSASVKSELSSSPYLDLSPSPPHTFSFHFPSSASAPNSTAQINHNFTTTSNTLPDRPYYRFGSMAHPEDAWLSKRSTNSALDLNSLSFPDEYDDGDELPDPPGSSGAPATSSGYSDRVVRRRSSKGTVPVRLKYLFSPCLIIRQLAINAAKANVNASAQEMARLVKAASCWGRVSLPNSTRLTTC
ncbi:uncharacterized protein BJ212DRAFT_750620 [Suillus subaureus]|uniref:Uncharacterized protein n=1 Tax=Suillus subaureus TaxID=48587 RepID=A0A9P7E0H6_9AGAM|nr:uncharacterized protein BJ212DRAFT_750620 [Suillus subaureus]KAG1807514.1 hypothetical protein BJ212DRAFT_750620 [Suillus subaureus]